MLEWEICVAKVTKKILYNILFYSEWMLLAWQFSCSLLKIQNMGKPLQGFQDSYMHV